MKKIIKNSKTSCNLQLKEIIRSMARQNCRDKDFTIPSEVKLCAFHDLARGTVRKAISELVDEGILIKCPGKGTFVNTAYYNEDSSFHSSGGLIAFITTLQYDSYSTHRLVDGIEKVTSNHGYLTVFKSSNSNTSEKKIIDVLSKRCDGIIVYSNATEELLPVYRALKEKSYPFVMVDRYFPELETDQVVVDESAGCYNATKFFLQKGVKHFVYFDVKQKISSSTNRLNSFNTAINEQKNITSVVKKIDFKGLENIGAETEPIKETIIAELGKYKEIAVLTIHDGLATMVYDICKKNKILVPEQVEIMGYGNEPSGRERGISTMDVDVEDMGRKAANLLLDKIEYRSRKCQQIKIDSKIILRKTTVAQS